ncbi:hypothetical protein AAA799E16_01246 [Marine Group I thaumarchaeote SCGC AAA799-E16]|uniref:Uncharacterized protein n=4 Tax=Marine Group I TaxID=905826 RepID=A0A087S7M0_9ARCH|nr:hypothetical protein AAA799N04_00939 [Marine Group I thaumarchaeote SCGC AAA799-N04]KER06069.1 hypothetical protein AAA799E16_01246 [Marine Group I thaumarchaeote SCGC AAA799-E16]KFM18149.1 hypothetical protein SCCGRSA3_01290 [Marine Group I thaumarchaeote SCGC RSA3]KFM21724.1 hypothetical protein AAA799B03_00673 [Marine Group I thaumarchaeote SCGC AAA799-B03]
MGAQELTSEQKEEIQQRIIEACKKDVGHVQKICSEV